MGHMHHKGHEMGHKKAFQRKFMTKDEKKEWLSNYVDDLKKELQAAEEKLKSL